MIVTFYINIIRGDDELDVLVTADGLYEAPEPDVNYPGGWIIESIEASVVRKSDKGLITEDAALTAEETRIANDEALTRLTECGRSESLRRTNRRSAELENRWDQEREDRFIAEGK